MSCQHPNCSRPIHSICTNHCHWSLCLEHINEHQRSLVIEFEEVLRDLIDPTNELSKSVEQTNKSSNENEQAELDHLKQSHQNQIDKIEQQLIEINKFQDQYNQMSKQLTKIKTNDITLTHNDFHQIDLLLTQINQYQVSLTDKQETITDLQQQQQQKQILPAHCPLTCFHSYGLLPSHNVPICSSKRKMQHLFEHFRNYHHLSNHYCNELIKAVTLNLDPSETKIFPPTTKIIVIDDKQPCPLNNASIDSGIPCTPCTNMVTDKLLPMHLKIVHRLRVSQIQQIIKTK